MTTQKKRILVVDDEVQFSRLLQLNLQQTGDYVVQVVNDPLGAVAAAETFQPDLILLDVMMPQMDGGALAAQFQARARLKQVPIVFLTAAVKRGEVAAHGGNIGGLSFLAKPADLKEILDCIKRRVPTG